MRYFALEVQAQKTADAIGASAAQGALSRLQANPAASPSRVRKVQERLKAEQATTPTPPPAPVSSTAGPKPAAAAPPASAVAKPAPASAVAKPAPASAGAVAKPAGTNAVVPYQAPAKAFASNAGGHGPAAFAPPKPGFRWGKGLALAGAGLLASMRGESRDY